MGGTVNAAIPLSVAAPPPVQGPLDQARAGMSLQALINETRLQQQQQQIQQQQVQQQQIVTAQQKQDFEDTQNLRQAFMESGGDWNQTMQRAQQLGVNPQKIFQLQTQHIDQLTKMSTLDKDLLANETQKHDAIARDAQTVLSADPADRQALWTKLANQHYVNGTFKPGEIPTQVPDDNGLLEIRNSSKATLDALKEAQELAQKQATDPAAAAKAQAEKIQSGAAMLANATSEPTYQLLRGSLKNQKFSDTDLAQYPEHFSPEALAQLKQTAIGPVEQAKLLATMPAEKIEMNSWLQQNPNKTPADYVVWKAQHSPSYILQSGALGAMTTPPAGGGANPIDLPAMNYLQTGQMPAGMRSPMLSAAIMKRAAEMAQQNPELGNLAANRSAFEANKKSYDNVTGTLDTLSAFEQAGLKNLKQFTDLADKLPDTGVPWLNTPVRLLNKNLVGDQWMPAIEAARSIGLREVARVTNDPKLKGVLTDSARQEVEGFSPTNATLPQILNVVHILQNDMANVHSSLAAQKADIGQRLGIQPTSKQAGGGEAAKPTTGTTLMKAPNGQTKPVPNDQVEHYKSMGATVVQ